MTRLTAVFLLLASTGAIWADPRQVVPDGVQIEDADTLLVDEPGGGHRIQLPGIDAPESTMNPKLQRDVQRTGLTAETLLELGTRADAGLRSLLDEFSLLRFDPEARDRYGRVPGDMFDAQGRRLSVRLVREGYAVPMPTADSAQSAELDAALREAQAGGHGLWGSHPATFAAWAGTEPAPER